MAAEIVLSETIHPYEVSSLTASELRAEMSRVGPKGYWGYGRWWIRWDGDCQLKVALDIDLPQHSRPEALDPELRASWDRMVAALLAHEREHTAHGIAAAKEIERYGCATAQAIIGKWAEQDRLLDKATEHGRLSGVQLPDPEEDQSQTGN